MEENLVKVALEALVESELENNPDDYCDNRYARYKIIVENLNEFIEENEAGFASFTSDIVTLLECNDSEIYEYIDEYYSEDICCIVETGSEYKKLYDKALICYKEVVMNRAIEELKNLKLGERLFFFVKLKELNIKPTKELYEKYSNCGENKLAFVKGLETNSNARLNGV